MRLFRRLNKISSFFSMTFFSIELSKINHLTIKQTADSLQIMAESHNFVSSPTVNGLHKVEAYLDGNSDFSIHV